MMNQMKQTVSQYQTDSSLSQSTSDILEALCCKIFAMTTMLTEKYLLHPCWW